MSRAWFLPARLRRIRRFRSDCRGTTAIEFAFGAIVLTVAMLGAIDFTLAMWTTNTLKQVAADGGRFAAIRGAEKVSPATANDVIAYIRDRVAGLDPDSLLVDVTWSPNNTAGSKVIVTIGYDFGFVAMGFLPLAPVRLEQKSIMTVG